MLSKFSCPVCELDVFDSHRALEVHVGKTHPESDVDLGKVLALRDLSDGTITPRFETTTKTGNTTCQYTCWTCGFQTKQPSKFSDHLVSHNLDPAEEFSRVVLKSEHPTCACGCGKRVQFYGWKTGFTSKFLKGHNYSTSAGTPESRKKAIAGRLEFYANGGKVWNDGLTKTTDERVKRSSEKISEGLLEHYKHNDSWLVREPEKAKVVREKMRTKILEGYRNGRTSWNKGLTKETDERLAEIAGKISAAGLKSLLRGRFTPEEVADRFALSTQFDLLDDVSIYQNKYTEFQVRCRTCGTVAKKTVVMISGSPNFCKICAPQESKGQMQIYDFVKSLRDDAVLSDRSLIAPKELDVVVPSSRFAIEYNGIFYHSELCLPDPENYHQRKTEKVTAAGYKLLHIFEDEWRDKPDIVKSVIRHAVGASSHRISARSCEIREISPSDAVEFHIATHLDGGGSSPAVAWGLFSDDKLISVLSLKRPYVKSLRDGSFYEVSRFSSLPDHNVVGGLGKLLSAAKKWSRGNGASKLMTYVDLRSGTGSGYEKCGFEEVRRTVNRWWWCDGSRRLHRLKYTADKVRGLTEREVAAESGAFKIYGCQNRVMVLKL